MHVSPPMPDCSSMCALFQGHRALGVGDGAVESIRSHNGSLYIHACCCALVVPLHVRVPDASALQSSIQSGSPDIHDLVWEEG